MPTTHCPTCGKPLATLPDGSRAPLPTLSTRPFCSARCRAADLGSWLNESYRIGSPLSEEDLDAGVPPGLPSASDDEEN